jgi:hypothetical protein
MKGKLIELAVRAGRVTSTNKKETRVQDPLTGKFFHSFTADRKLSWQGQVLKHVRGDFYLVQLFEWLMGEPSAKELVPMSGMVGWSFYDTTKELHAAYADYDQRSGRNAG